MVTEQDLKRIFECAENSTILGVNIGTFLQKWTKYSLSKIILVICMIICTIVFIIFGILNRKKKD